MEQKASDFLAGNIPNIQSTRILSTLEDTAKKQIDTKNINLESGIDDVIASVDKKLTPLYEVAYAKNTNINDLELYKYLESNSILKNAYKDAIDFYRQKLVAKGIEPVDIPKLNKLLVKEKGKVVGIKQTLPLEFLDLIKRVADQKLINKL